MRHSRRAGGTALLALLLVTLAASPAWAHRDTPERKLLRGIAAMTTGFLELPGQMYEVGQERGAAWGLTLGFAQGLGHIVARELIGVYEFLTFPVELPAGFEPILEPEFPWGYFEGA